MSDKIVEAQKVRRTATRTTATRARRDGATSDNGVNESNRSTR